MNRFARNFLPIVTIIFGMIAVALVVPQRARGGEGVSFANGNGSIIAFGRNVTADHHVAGDVEVINGSAIITDEVDGDVVVIGGDIDLRSGAVIHGDVISVAGTVQQDPLARVAGRIMHPGGRGSTSDGHEAVSALKAGINPLSLFTLAMKVSLLLIWLVVAVVVTLVNGREIRSSSMELRVSFFHSLLLGLVAFTSFILTALLLSYIAGTVVGVPLLAVLGAFAIITKAYGMVAVFHAIGSLITGARTRAQLASRRWMLGDLAMVVIGLFVLGAIRLIPIVGTAVWVIASVVAVGTALATRFGRRDPWFLTWRTIQAGS